MEQELSTLDEQMKAELQSIKDKYSSLKKVVKSKYKKIEQNKQKEKKLLEKEELKKARKSIPKTLKNQVWNKCVGKEKGVGECNVCKCEIDSKNFDCGHITSVKEGGETNESNLVPLCSPCNKSMGSHNLTEFKDKYFKDKQSKKEDGTKVDGTKVDGTKVDTYIEHMLCYTDEKVAFQVMGIRMVDIPGHNMFLSMDDIFVNYRKWIHEHYCEYYDKTKFDECFGEPNDKKELTIKLTKTYGEMTSNPDNTNVSMNDWKTKKGYGFTHIKFV